MVFTPLYREWNSALDYMSCRFLMLTISIQWGRLNGQRKRAFTTLFPSESGGPSDFVRIPSLTQLALMFSWPRQNIYTIAEEMKFCIGLWTFQLTNATNIDTVSSPRCPTESSLYIIFFILTPGFRGHLQPSNAKYTMLGIVVKWEIGIPLTYQKRSLSSKLFIIPFGKLMPMPMWPRIAEDSTMDH